MCERDGECVCSQLKVALRPINGSGKGILQPSRASYTPKPSSLQPLTHPPEPKRTTAWLQQPDILRSKKSPESVTSLSSKAILLSMSRVLSHSYMFLPSDNTSAQERALSLCSRGCRALDLAAAGCRALRLEYARRRGLSQRATKVRQRHDLKLGDARASLGLAHLVSGVVAAPSWVARLLAASGVPLMWSCHSRLCAKCAASSSLAGK